MSKKNITKLNSIVKFLNDELKIKKISDFSKNGLQVKCKPEVSKIGFAVDGCITTFEKAKKLGCDLIIVHHGVKWIFNKNYPDKTKINKKRTEWLKKNKISLYGVHLPLDSHEKYGNNIQLANLLDLKNIKKFGNYHGNYIGYSGTFKNPTTVTKISTKLNKKIKANCKNFAFGKKSVKTIGIVSGGGGDAFPEAIQKKLDCFLVGEMNHGDSTKIKDNKYNTIIAGHYATETVGIKALMPVLKEKFNIQCVFIEDPTGI